MEENPNWSTCSVHLNCLQFGPGLGVRTRLIGELPRQSERCGQCWRWSASNREQGRPLYGAKAEQSSLVRLVSGLRQFVVGVAQLGDRVSATPQRGHYGRAVAGVLADCKAAVNPMLLGCELADQALCIGHLEGPGYLVSAAVGRRRELGFCY